MEPVSCFPLWTPYNGEVEIGAGARRYQGVSFYSGGTKWEDDGGLPTDPPAIFRSSPTASI